MEIREATREDLAFLEVILLEAYNWAEVRFDLDWVRTDDMARRLLDGFPGDGDLGVILPGAGAAWGRALPRERASYGFVAEDVPELALGALPHARGQGVGTRLLDSVIASARERGFPALSLSVEDGNGARRIYERAGFEVVGRNGGSDTMLLRLPA